ncbi:hypothetical protein [Mesorhizobium helmanticense]|uniref:Uncharacterized protein n=1 Tax=Mesorhizobium helmanticense TaxID=1776423 RepID=A0A2T4IT49_9HYPH|nr:hypothetical protein [Mesorhizobium helmanticense]PTE08821.1 hypothetical protein C9427_19385 [Mesorhizobium helmanticense]
MEKYVAGIFAAVPGLALTFVTAWFDLLRSSALMRGDLSAGWSNAALAIAALLCTAIALLGKDWPKAYKSRWAGYCITIFIVLGVVCIGSRIFLSAPQTRFWQETVVKVWDLSSVGLAVAAILMITFATMAFTSDT